MFSVNTIEKPRLSVKVQTLSALAAVIGAVVLPQIFHAVGAALGLGTAVGEALLPMHLPIILVGLLAGPWAGAAAGLLGPLASFALSGMPTAVMLPVMMLELCGYGLFAGLLRNVKMPSLGKVVIAQAGRCAVRAIVILTAVYLLGSESLNVPMIWNSITAGFAGLALQWVLIPIILYRVENAGKHE